MSARAVGVVRLHFGSCFIILDNVYLIPRFTRNLISVSKLLEQLYSVSFNNMSVIIAKNGLNICSGLNENNLYVLRPLIHTIPLNAELFKVKKPKTKRQTISLENETYLWHLRLGHINLDRIDRLVKSGPLSELKVGILPVCESCLEGKMTKRPFTGKGLRAEETP